MVAHVSDRGSCAQGIAAISCLGVGKVFPVFDDGMSWRLLLGAPPNGKTFRALSEIALTVPKGQVVGILGRNGAGKSTLLRVLAGIYAPTTGSVRRNGSVGGLFELGAAGNRFLSGREYARRSLLLQGAERAHLPELLDEIRGFSELEMNFDAPIYTLSTGMAARLYFAAATALEHDVYLIDEILTVGDEHFQSKCWARIRNRLKRGASAVLVAHDWTQILRLCEVAHIMEHGRIVASGSAEETVRSYLNLSREFETHVAQFCAGNPDEYDAQSQQDAEFRMFVQVHEAVPVVLAYSVEYLSIGVGWEMLLLADDLPVASARGRYEVRLSIPRLPLARGRYYLNVFLSSPTVGGRRTRVAPYDARSWTYGNPISLIVHGDPSGSATMVPLNWVRDGVTP